MPTLKRQHHLIEDSDTEEQAQHEQVNSARELLPITPASRGRSPVGGKEASTAETDYFAIIESSMPQPTSKQSDGFCQTTYDYSASETSQISAQSLLEIYRGLEDDGVRLVAQYVWYMRSVLGVDKAGEMLSYFKQHLKSPLSQLPGFVPSSYPMIDGAAAVDGFGFQPQVFGDKDGKKTEGREASAEKVQWKLTGEPEVIEEVKPEVQVKQEVQKKQAASRVPKKQQNYIEDESDAGDEDDFSDESEYEGELFEWKGKRFHLEAAFSQSDREILTALLNCKCSQSSCEEAMDTSRDSSISDQELEEDPKRATELRLASMDTNFTDPEKALGQMKDLVAFITENATRGSKKSIREFAKLHRNLYLLYDGLKAYYKNLWDDKRNITFNRFLMKELGLDGNPKEASALRHRCNRGQVVQEFVNVCGIGALDSKKVKWYVLCKVKKEVRDDMLTVLSSVTKKE